MAFLDLRGGWESPVEPRLRTFPLAMLSRITPDAVVQDTRSVMLTPKHFPLFAVAYGSFEPDTEWPLLSSKLADLWFEAEGREEGRDIDELMIKLEETKAARVGFTPPGSLWSYRIISVSQPVITEKTVNDDGFEREDTEGNLARTREDINHALWQAVFERASDLTNSYTKDWKTLGSTFTYDSMLSDLTLGDEASKIENVLVLVIDQGQKTQDTEDVEDFLRRQAGHPPSSWASDLDLELKYYSPDHTTSDLSPKSEDSVDPYTGAQDTSETSYTPDFSLDVSLDASLSPQSEVDLCIAPYLLESQEAPSMEQDQVKRPAEFDGDILSDSESSREKRQSSTEPLATPRNKRIKLEEDEQKERPELELEESK